MLCALPIDHVAETMRPLPIEPLPGVPAFVLGVSVVRGQAIPVVDAARLLGADDAPAPHRFVTLALGERRAALAVCDVVGIRFIPASLGELPPLLQQASAELVEAMGTLDGALLLVLKSGSLVPESAWAALDAEVRA
jgi:purine-binding chemotaxis protein CheW